MGHQCRLKKLENWMIMALWIQNTKKRGGRMEITDNGGYVKPAMVWLLALLVALAAAVAESKFLSFQFP
jgi:hypothetical protein